MSYMYMPETIGSRLENMCSTGPQYVEARATGAVNSAQGTISPIHNCRKRAGKRTVMLLMKSFIEAGGVQGTMHVVESCL